MVNQYSIITCGRNILVTLRRKENTTPILLEYKRPYRLDACLVSIVENYFFFGIATPYRVLINPIDAFCYVFGKSYHNCYDKLLAVNFWTSL
mgnify:CR=1 FL=1